MSEEFDRSTRYPTEPSPFPYTPHFTLRSLTPVPEEEATALLSLCIPEPFVLDTLSVYMLDTLPMTLLHRTLLTGKRNG